MDLYIASGPFHVFNIVNLKQNENAQRSADVIIIADTANGDVTGMLQLHSQLMYCGMFRNVYLLKDEQIKALTEATVSFPKMSNWLLRNIKRVFAYNRLFINDRAYVNTDFGKEKYSHVYCAGTYSYLELYILVQIIRHGAMLIYFDDGLGSRTVNRFQATTFNARLFHLLGGEYTGRYVSGNYFYSPDLVTGRYRGPVLKQNPPQDRSVMRQVFNYDLALDFLSQYDIIYLTSSLERYPNLVYAVESAYIEKNFIDESVDFFENQNICVKVHPLSQFIFLPKTTVQHAEYPFEVSCCFQELNNKVLITVFSVAVYNPKFILDQEPYIIFTYKFLKIPVQNYMSTCTLDFEEINDVMLRRCYRNPEKILVPEAKEEFFQIIERLSSLRKNAGP